MDEIDSLNSIKPDLLQAARDEMLDYAKPICRVASDTPLPPLRAINHTIPFIDESKILPWRASLTLESFALSRSPETSMGRETEGVSQLRPLESFQLGEHCPDALNS
jgi:hypothetical protein